MPADEGPAHAAGDLSGRGPSRAGRPWRHWPWMAWLVPPLAVGLLLRLLESDLSLWSDEVYTLQLARLELGQIWAEPDQTPPLYAMILHAWRAVAGEREWVLRLPSLAASLATIPLVALLARRLLGGTRAGDRARDGAAFIAAWLCAVSPLLVIQGHEARAYSLLTALCVAGPLLLLRAAQTGSWKTRLAWSLVAAAALYTHVFAAFFLLGQTIFWWSELRDRITPRHAALMALVAGLVFLPWLPVLVGRLGFVAGGFWIGSPTTSMVLITLCALAGGWAAAVVHAATSLTAWPARLRTWLALIALPVLIPFLASFAVPMFTPRYVVPAVALVCVPLAMGLGRVPGKIRMPAAVAAVVAALLSVPAVGVVPFPLDFQQDWRGAADDLEAHAPAGAAVVWLPGLCEGQRERDLTCPMGVYGHRTDLHHIGYGDPARRPGPESLGELAGRLGNATDVWLVQADTAVGDRFLQEWLAANYGEGGRFHKDGVLIVRYTDG